MAECLAPCAVCGVTTNRDDYHKNHGFLMDAARGWWLVPAYDVTYSFGPGGEHTLTIAGEGRKPGRRSFAAVARESGISAPRAAEIVDEVEGTVADWLEYADAIAVPFDATSRVWCYR